MSQAMSNASLYRKKSLLGCFAIAAITIALTADAAAAVWAWGCMGRLGHDRVIFNRNSLIVTAEKLPTIRLRDLKDSSRSLEATDGMTFDNLGSNDGFAQTMRFKKMDASERMLTLIEIKSSKTSERKGHVGRREESTTIFRKTFRYAPDKEPERKITMQCIEYVLTTCGGPCS